MDGPTRMLSNGLDETQLTLIRDSARTIASHFDLEYWREHDAEHKYPWDFIKAFAKQGWFGSLVPVEYGGMGIGLTAAAIMLQEAAYVGGLNAASALHFYVFPAVPIVRHGSEEMKRNYLPAIACGEIMMCFGVTEP